MKEIIWVDSKTGKKYKLVGKCINCGRCCRLDCDYFRWIANSDIPKGTQISETGNDKLLRSLCLGEQDGTKPESCQKIPSFPQHIRGRCGFNFADEEGNIYPTPDRSFPRVG